jgi:hypothetical protein
VSSTRQRPGRPPRLALPWIAAALALAAVSGCESSDPAPTAASTPAPQASRPPEVSLGTPQQVTVASAFGPGTESVPVRITVFAVRDQVAPRAAIRPRAALSHWASADVEACRSKPVVLGFPAWVLGDDDGRTAQVTKVLHKAFPQPTFDNSSTKTGCQRGWVTFVTPDDLTPTKVTFEQTTEVPGAWRIARQ